MNLDHHDVQEDVLAFHRKFGLHVGYSPTIPDARTVALRGSLILEEANETVLAIGNGDLAGIADGIVDSIYVLVGTAISYGIDLAPVWEAVQRANMAKEGGATREDGKILKPAGWTPPDIHALIQRQIAHKTHGATKPEEG